jgi:hypothetical protein
MRTCLLLPKPVLSMTLFLPVFLSVELPHVKPSLLSVELRHL